jgi:hypothetical protein
MIPKRATATKAAAAHIREAIITYSNRLADLSVSINYNVSHHAPHAKLFPTDVWIRIALFLLIVLNSAWIDGVESPLKNEPTLPVQTNPPEVACYRVVEGGLHPVEGPLLLKPIPSGAVSCGKAQERQYCGFLMGRSTSAPRTVGASRHDSADRVRGD